MQRIHRPPARRQCIDEGYRLRSGEIAYRKRRVSHSESKFSKIAQNPGGDPGGVPDDEQAKIAAGNTTRVYNVARLTVAA
jgi:hypothetical protein